MKVIQSKLQRRSSGNSLWVRAHYRVTPSPFSVRPSHGVICAANEARLLVTFTPRDVSHQQGLLIFVCEKGFGVTKIVKIQNISTIPFSITFETGTHLAVSPSQVRLNKMDVIEVEITYFASEVNAGDSCVYINMETVGKIFEISVAVRCCVPSIQIQCPRIELDSCFFNHPREFSVPLVNPSDLPANYFIQPIKNTNIQLTLTSPEGLLPPEKVTFVPLQVIAKVTGVVSLNLAFAINGADYNPLVVEVVCHCVGPVLLINTEKVHFGRIEALTPIQHTIPLSNESPIPAHLTSIRVQKSIAFRVSPPELSIPPFGRAEIEVTACANDVDVEIFGLLEICVENVETPSYTIQLLAIGVGSTITIEPEIPLNLPLGQQFESLPQARVFAVKNCGRRQQRLVWTVENLLCIQKVECNRKSKKPDYKILLDPPKFELKPFQGLNFSVKVTSTRSMEIKFTLKCYTVIGNAGHKRLIRECTVSAEFIKPMIGINPNPVNFFLLKELTLSGKGGRSICIGFAPPLAKYGSTSFVVDTHLSISFLKHPLKITIPVHSEIHFPSLRLENDSLDFGSVENGRKVAKSVILLNSSPIEVNYQWKLIHGSLKDNKREPSRLPTRSKSQELCSAPATSLVHSSSVARIDDLHITDVFTITPETGRIPAGKSVSACFEFHAPSDVSARCVAICEVSDGLDYTVNLKGECSIPDCYIRTNKVSFGEIQFSEEAVELFYIYNAGKVSSTFHFTWDRNDVNLQILPMEGEVPGKGLTEIAMCVEVPQPKEFTVFAKVCLDGKHSEQIRIHGKACFPHVVLNSGIRKYDSLCKTEMNFIASLLATEHSNLPLTLPPYEVDFCNIIRGEVKERKLTFAQVCHDFAYQLHIEKMSRKVLAEKGVVVQIGVEISITFDTFNSETGHITLEIPLKACHSTDTNDS
ncbi:Hydrocephalus-inducing protein [Taenia crassiceps]|uniref:Hydrocephalus-inducing protein n=1 Tax=Taenia crassiceps TaxID=6207 RepID=A0ABR4QQ09_9CEST